MFNIFKGSRLKQKLPLNDRRARRGRNGHLGLEALESRAMLTFITVNSTLDVAVDLTDDVVTLRDAIEAANNDLQVSAGGPTGSGADTIFFDPNVFFATPQTIDLTLGELSVSDDLVIDGPGADLLTISGNDSSRIFSFGSGWYAVLELAIANGYSTGFGGAITTRPGHVLTIEDSIIRDSRADLAGGAINANVGTLNLLYSTVSGNSAGAQGGGINFQANDNSVVTNSTISGNSTDGLGVGGGGFLNLATADDTSLVTLNNVTMADNTANNGSSFHTGTNRDTSISATTQYRNSIFTTTAASNITSRQRGGTATNLSLGNNISSDGSGNLTAPGDLPNTDPLLGPLQNNGGPTPTHALLYGSPAIDAGDNSLAVDDQRGFPRPLDGNGDGTVRVDIGAVESPPPIVVDTITDESDGDFGPGDLSLREAIELANAAPGPDAVTFDPAVFGSQPQTIALTLGELSVSDDLVIDGPGADLLTISGNDSSRIFSFRSGVYAVLELSVANGYSTGFGGAITTRPGHVLTIEDSIIRDSRADNAGGAIQARHGTLNLLRSTVSGNSAGTQGGGINFQASDNSVLTNSTISGNSTDGLGVGGGGFYNAAFANDTSLVTLNNVTMADNTANDGSSFRTQTNRDTSISATTQYRNSIFTTTAASNITSRQSGGTATNLSLGNNISSDGSGNLTAPGDLPNTDPLLGPLQNNGGPTPTHAPLYGSPAIDAGDNALAVDANNDPLQFDQRGAGFGRVDGGRVDIGAFEVNVAPTLLSFTRQTPTAQPTNADSLVFRATFDEDVQNVDATDFSVHGGTTATITNVNSVDARTYDITVSGGDLAGFNGTVGLNVANATNITDAVGNALPTTEPNTDETFTLDNIAPQVESIRYDEGTGQRSVIRSITVTFDSQVVVDPGAFVLTTKSGTPVSVTPELSVVNGKTQAVLMFSGALVDASGSLLDGNYVLTILDTHVRDLANNVLDGDKDGMPGAAAWDEFFRFFGDTDGDRDVDLDDLLAFLGTFRRTSNMQGFNAILDSDNDNDVDATDLSAFLARHQRMLSP